MTRNGGYRWLGLVGVWVGCLGGLNVAVAGPPGRQGDSGDFARELAYLDSNGDGRIDVRELASGQQMAELMLAVSWQEADRNGDGAISAAEWSAAAGEARQTLLDEQSADAEQAATALAEAVPLSLVLERLSRDKRYAAEIAELREAVENLDDEEAVYTHIYGNPARYVRLRPAVRAWWRHYPVRGVRSRYGKPYWSGRHGVGPGGKAGVRPDPRGKLKPGGAKPPKKAAPGGVKKPPKAGKKPGPKGGRR